MDPAQLLIRLRETTMDLMDLHKELATIQMAEARARAEAWRDSSSSSAAGAESESRYAAMDFTCDKMKVQGDIAALREDKDFLTAALEAFAAGVMEA